ncbi:hypothetical protein BC332_01533 [Capsicum chinense]|nr:hypothetical protein BC332_01533 [Capsicum chinense]
MMKIAVNNLMKRKIIVKIIVTNQVKKKVTRTVAINQMKKKKDDESTGEESSENEKNGERESEQSDEKEKEDKIDDTGGDDLSKGTESSDNHSEPSYLLKKLDPTKSQYNLQGFPWAFTAWAFEDIPTIQRLSKDPSPERSFPRMIRWMTTTPAHNLTVDLIDQTREQYKNLSDKSLVDGALPMHKALALFEMDSNILKYYSGEKPYPCGRKWDGAKRIYTVMNIKNTHFIALEFLMEKGLIQVYDCNIDVYDEPTFLTSIQPILESWPKQLKQSRVFNYFPGNFLNDAWSYERLKDVPRRNSCTACGPYAYVSIDHLLTGMDLMCLNYNKVDNFRMRYVFVVIKKELNP